MRTVFYIVRHGETLFNKLGRIQGHCDSPLTEQGIEMAKELKLGLQDIHFDLAASSTLGRAMDTVNYIVQGTNVPIRYEAGLKELNFGDKEGALVKMAAPPFEIERIGYKFCGGENRDECGLRFKKSLEKLAVEGNVLVVSHASAIFAMLQLLDLSIEYVRTSDVIYNCSVTKIELVDGKFRILEMPTTKYLDKGKCIKSSKKQFYV